MSTDLAQVFAFFFAIFAFFGGMALLVYAINKTATRKYHPSDRPIWRGTESPVSSTRGAVLSAQTIEELQYIRMIEPFVAEAKLDSKGNSYGLGPCTYDVRIAENITLNPGDFVLAHTIEKFNLPNNVCMSVKDKSSLIRRGLKVHNTHCDPGWKGWLTLELELSTGVMEPLSFNAGDAIAQVKFEFLDKPTGRPYKGKYQNQEDIPVPAR